MFTRKMLRSIVAATVISLAVAIPVQATPPTPEELFRYIFATCLADKAACDAAALAAVNLCLDGDAAHSPPIPPNPNPVECMDLAVSRYHQCQANFEQCLFDHILILFPLDN